MKEKDMVLDVLESVKASIQNYAKIITECGDLNLRQTFQQMQTNDMQFQYDLYKIAEQKGYYIAGTKATSQDCSSLKTQLTQSINELSQPVPMI